MDTNRDQNKQTTRLVPYFVIELNSDVTDYLRFQKRLTMRLETL